jgi:ParB family chromosome partitioning protein
MSDRIQRVSVDLLEIKDHLDRTKLEISSLVDSLQNTGQINPIVVKPMSGGKYRVVAGRRRTSALKSLQAMTGKKQMALVVIKDLDKVQEELITIDENIMRQQLTDSELDEALFRRKQLYEELHPETKQHVSGGVSKNTKPAASDKLSPAFAKDAAKKLHISKRTVERAVARAGKASDKVKQARAQGLSKSKVDLLVALPQDEQNLLLPVVSKQDVSQSKKLIEEAKRIGAKAAVLYFKDEHGEEEDHPELKVLVKEAGRLHGLITHALEQRRVFNSKAKFRSVKQLEALSSKINEFVDYQKAALGETIAIRRRGSEQKVIRASLRP